MARKEIINYMDGTTGFDFEGLLAKLREQGGKYAILADQLQGVQSKSRRRNMLEIRAKSLEVGILYMIRVVDDRQLIKLGESETCFPRGFPLYWDGSSFHARGFLPKFANDDRNDELPILDGILELLASVKYSDSLVLAVKFPGCSLATTSKNSFNVTPAKVDNKWAVAYERLFPKSEDLLKVIESEGLTICAEIFLEGEKTHGYLAKKDAFVVTAISRPSETNAMVEYMSTHEMHDFCMKYGLPVGDLYVTEDLAVAKAFSEVLNEERNMMTSVRFTEIVAKFGMKILNGNFDPSEVILGDSIEGIVFFMKTADGTKIVKYKFPVYTMVTFGIREALNSKEEFDFGSHLISCVNHWCIDVPEEKKYWSEVVTKAWNTLVALKEDPRKIIAEGKHVLAFEAARKEIPLPEKGSYVKKKQEKQPLYLIVCIGPVSWGKSTSAKAIAAALGSNARNVDTDVLSAFGRLDGFGMERNFVVVSELLRAFYEGSKYVILSSNCNNFLDRSKNVQLHKIIENAFPGYKLNVLMVRPTDRVLENAQEITRKGTVWRIGEPSQTSWTGDLDKTLKIVAGITDQVVANIRGIPVTDTICIDYEMITQDWVPGSLALNTITKYANTSVPKQVVATQIRTVVRYGDKVLHATMHFGTKSFSIEELRKKYIDPISGFLKKLEAEELTFTGNNKLRYVFLHIKNMPKIENHELPHVTVSSGSCAPATSKLLLEKYLAGESSFTVVNKKKEDVTFNKVASKETTCEILGFAAN